MLMLTLPYPPSVNTYWGFKGSHRYLTDKAKTFKEQVRWYFIASKHTGFGGHRLKVEIDLYPPDNRIRDIDNNIKSLLDSLCQAGVFTDDCQIDKITVERRQIVKKGACVVRIEIYN